MPNPMSVGSILIEVDTFLPHAVRIECEAFSKTWETLTSPDRRAFEKELGAAGWNLFYLAGNTSASAPGSDKEKTLHRAVDRVLARIRLQGFNCAEITAVERRSFWGIPYVAVSAHARNIQPGIVLSRRKGIAKSSQASSALVAATAEG